MIDRFGNTLSVGDTVVYFSTGYAPTARVGMIIEFARGSVKIKTTSHREVLRSAGSLIHYTGIANGL